ncbi:hypothetical protein [Moorena sp. SIO3H5]|uniref:hypothetical protein n=1 Tax=Moorena sp. SIO3H5 TaxID=2607834 RepID=UPI0025EDF863|nr:hypothetical protein [Moorena sp. SIO3H5]
MRKLLLVITTLCFFFFHSNLAFALDCPSGPLPNKDQISTINNGIISSCTSNSKCPSKNPCYCSVSGTWAKGPEVGSPITITECYPECKANGTTPWKDIGSILGIGLTAGLATYKIYSSLAADAADTASDAAADAGDADDVGVLDDLADLMEGLGEGLLVAI